MKHAMLAAVAMMACATAEGAEAVAENVLVHLNADHPAPGGVRRLTSVAAIRRDG